MNRALAACIAAALTFAALLNAAADPPASIDPVVAKRIGAPTIAVVQSAVQVETFRVGPTDPQTPVAQRLDDRALTGVGMAQGAAFAMRLRTALFDPQLYPPIQDRCLFDPGVVFRVSDGKNTVDIVVCYKCSDLRIITRGRHGKVILDTVTNFTKRRLDWIALAKAAFPHDSELNALD